MKFKKTIVSICVIGLLAIIGCAGFQDILTPAYIAPEVIKEVDISVTTFMPFTTLFDAKRVASKLDYEYNYNRVINEMKYNHLNGLNIANIKAAEELKVAFFSPQGTLGALLPTIMAGTLGSILISKPDDKKKIGELEKKVNGDA